MQIFSFAWSTPNNCIQLGNFVVIGVMLLAAGCAPLKEIRGLDAHDDVLRIDTSVTVNDVKHHPIGINLNYLMDDDALLNPTKGIVHSLKNLGVKYLRFPGGEKSDSYLWTVPPWPNSRKEKLKPMLARTGPKEWPSNTEFTLADRSTLIQEILDFKEFMSICAELQCEPVIVVAADSHYVPPSESGTAPTRQELIESAVEWVRYANVMMGYGIKFWMIGNESWHLSYNGGTDAEKYARDLKDFSVAMKTIDPSISIIANGNSEKWWKTVLQTASKHIDYLGVSLYPIYNWNSFESYQKTNVKVDQVAKVAISAIKNHAPAQDKKRLQVIVTETNAINFGKQGWENRNDIGHALVLFQIFGDLLLQPKVAFSQLWTTRWVYKKPLKSPRVFDAIDRNGRLHATGMALAIWGNNLLDTMASTEGTRFVKIYASFSSLTHQLNVFLVNKATTDRIVSIDIVGEKSVGMVDSRVLSGNGHDDINPTWKYGTADLANQRIGLTLPPVSITVLKVQSN